VTNKAAPRRPAAVLIVDDEETVRVLLNRALEAEDRVITLAGSVSEALGHMNTTQFDLLLVDKNLPDGTGLDVIAKARNLGQKPEAIVITGYSDMDSAIKAVSMGVFRYVPKPFSLDNLKIDVHRAIETARMRRDLDRRSEQLKRSNEDLQAALQMVKQAESRRMQSERLATIGYLAAGAAHEINNPLSLLSMAVPYAQNEVQALAELIKRGKADQIDLDRLDRVLRTLEPTVDAIEFLMTLASDLHTLGRTTGQQPKPVTLSDSASAALRLVRHQLKHKARCVLEMPGDLAIMGLSNRLIQVFINLLTNAARAIDEGDVAGNEVAIRGALDGASAVVRVSDTGVGIAPENLSKIFAPFWTSSGPGGVQGSGIGLAIVKEIVAELDGKIEVHSEPGKGTVFTMTFPAVSPRVSVTALPAGLAADDALASTRKTILFVDSDPSNLEDYEETFGQLHHVLTAGDIDAARKTISERADQIDAIVCELLPSDHPLGAFHDEVVAQHAELEKRFIFLGEPGPLAGIAKVKNLNLLQRPVRPAVLLAEIFKIPSRVPSRGPAG
jgi:signal transduction histidine kinase